MKNINEELYDALYSQFRSQFTKQLGGSLHSGSYWDVPFPIYSSLDLQIHEQFDYPIQSQLDNTI